MSDAKAERQRRDNHSKQASNVGNGDDDVTVSGKAIALSKSSPTQQSSRLRASIVVSSMAGSVFAQAGSRSVRTIPSGGAHLLERQPIKGSAARGDHHAYKKSISNLVQFSRKRLNTIIGVS